MQNTKKQRLSELIEAVDRLPISNANKAPIYSWLVELEYLLDLFNTESELLKKIFSAIQYFRSTSYSCGKKFARLVALLKVFKRYELETMEFKVF